MGEAGFSPEKCFEYTSLSELGVRKYSDFECVALRCCVARRTARGRPSFGKGKPVCYALLQLLREREKASLSQLKQLLEELGRKCGVEVKVSVETLKDRFEELRKDARLQAYVNKVLAELEELKKKVKKRIKFLDRKVLKRIIEAYKLGNVEEAIRLVSEYTEYEPLRRRTIWLLRNAKPKSLVNDYHHLAMYVLVGVLGEKPKKPMVLPDVIYLDSDQLKKLCNPETYFDYEMKMKAAGFSTETIRRVVTPLKEICGEEMMAALKGRHGMLVQRGVKKGDEHVVYPEEFKAILDSNEFSWEEKLILATHITLGCREGGEYIYYAPGKKARGGLLGLRWEYLHWEERNGKLMPVKIDVLETKTAKGGREGVWWLGAPLDLFFDWLPEWLYEYAKRKGFPKEGYIFEGWSYHKLLALWRKVRRFVNKLREEGKSPTRAECKCTPHDARRTHALWLVLADVPLEVIAGVGLGQTRVPAPLGVSWADLTVMITYYADLVRKAQKEVSKVKSWARSVFA